ncbi:ABC transporter family protein [Clostridium argentinense CDC 2741]|uniref:ABC transporter family protein n=1 Tax=Clostridium argentinense CDC 2741 TaxID=1418104 RepID=A0A0C1U2I1_9CLOT|nr:ABC transporter ATP-binding protein [Clostridium argentinense]ARC85426.1 ABC transporter ATP-binding protein [Clostridium argentinense]KIE47064.1 ABC transporter family protein [Clostridium argentinense CDC 2741]NFF41279.1 ABC transporter ATP-binding protein [Clostridium argentinense]NFP52339.1 ABC transporter ATP-binding protein [Clostridium argentinense]NFP72006.1 ABC transporter ATP-binding protein [Clostridium argentinense]
MKILYNITAGNPEKLRKPIFFSVLSNVLNILPFTLTITAAKIIFESYSTGTALDIGKLWLTCGALFVSMIIMFLGEIPAYRSAYRGAFIVAAEGRAKLAEHLRQLPLGYLTSRDPGDLGNMMMGDFALIEHCISHLMPQLVGALVMPVIAFIGLLFLDWRMAIAMFVALPVGTLIIKATSKLQKRVGKRHMESKIYAANRLQEYLNGIGTIKAYNLTGERFTRLEKAFRQFMIESIKIEGFLQPIVLTALACIRAGLTVMVFVGTHLLLGGKLDIITFVTFLIVGTRVFDPLTTVLGDFSEINYDQQAGERIVNLLKEPILSGDKMPPEGHEIELKNVTFGYGTNSVLKDVSVKMSEGSLTALVGPSGSGKSTILKLIARFYDPQKGEVLIGNENMKNLEPEALLKKVSMVFQDVYLFQDTIGNNIRFGKENATQSEVEEVAKRACCHDFIMKLPQGYDTPVGEGGSTLSGGEKQRISIARAILKDAPVVLLDEATASLDPENEVDIQKAINELIQGRTVIVVAHRLKTICEADNIIVLDNGKVVEQGVHEELTSQKGLYSRLWNLQHQSSRWSISS